MADQQQTPAEFARRLKERQLRAIQAKITGGKSLTAGEQRVLDNIASGGSASYQAPWLHDTRDAMAESLGVTSRTLSTWRRRGCPVDGANDELGVRLWARAAGVACPTPPRGGPLASYLEAVERLLSAQRPVSSDALDEVPAHGAPTNWREERERQSALETYDRRRTLALEREKLRGALVPRAWSDRQANAVRDCILGALRLSIGRIVQAAGQQITLTATGRKRLTETVTEILDQTLLEGTTEGLRRAEEA
jgi:hypothetical protein